MIRQSPAAGYVTTLPPQQQRQQQSRGELGSKVTGGSFQQGDEFKMPGSTARAKISKGIRGATAPVSERQQLALLMQMTSDDNQ
ncbi:Aspartate--tRNA(Asp/Asn) ligase, partial [Frankliniella fusca]